MTGKSDDPKPARRPMRDARISGIVATLALVVMCALAALMVWLA